MRHVDLLDLVVVESLLLALEDLHHELTGGKALHRKTELSYRRGQDATRPVLTLVLHHVVEARRTSAKLLELVHGHRSLRLLPGNFEGERIRLPWLLVDLHPLRLRVIELTDLVLVLYRVCLILALCLVAGNRCAKRVVWRLSPVWIRHLAREDIITLKRDST